MMEEKETKTQVPTAPEVPETQETAEVAQDAEEITVDTPPSSEVDVEKDETSEAQVDTPDAKEENDKRSMAEKIKALENEKNEYLQKVKLLEALDSAAAGDPEFMKLANKKLVEQGVLDASVLEQLEQSAQSKGTDAGSAVTSDPAIAWAKQKMQEEQSKREEFFKNFEEARPDLADGDPEIVRANRQAVSAAAIRRIKSGESMEQAYDYAYKQIMHPEQLIEEGKLQGMAQAQSATPSTTGASGGLAQSSGKVELTPEQREAARLFGIAEEKYSHNLEE